MEKKSPNTTAAGCGWNTKWDKDRPFISWCRIERWEAQMIMVQSDDAARTLRVLHVEDNDGDVRLIAEALRESGIGVDVFVVPDGSQAMEFLRREAQFSGAQRPDLILLDLNLPKKGGREVLAEIKRDPALKTIPVVVLSTSSAPLEIAEAYELHANCYVTKPVDLHELFVTIGAIGKFWLRLAKLPLAAN
jgi:CheY-like chemotaxis protein